MEHQTKDFDFIKQMKGELPSMQKGLEDMTKAVKKILDFEQSIETKDIEIDGINCKLFLKPSCRVMIQFPTEEAAYIYFHKGQAKLNWFQRLFS